jgi:hypothetical protein
MATTEKNDDELVLIADHEGLWVSPNIMAKSLRAAMQRSAEISRSGGSPYPLKGPDGTVIEHLQMRRLWHRLGMTPANKPGS